MKKNRQNKTQEVLQFSEDRLQLLDTIHEMVNDELKLRRFNQKGDPHPENPPPEVTGGGTRFRRTSLWQRIKKIILSKNFSSTTE